MGSRKNWSSQQSDASSHSHIHWENLPLMGLLCPGVRRKLPVGYWLARLVDHSAATRGWLWPGWPAWWGGRLVSEGAHLLHSFLCIGAGSS